MEDSCTDCVKKNAEIVAIRSANEGLRAKVREMEKKLAALEANTLASFADYDEKLSKLRRFAAQHMFDEIAEKDAKVDAPTSPG